MNNLNIEKLTWLYNIISASPFRLAEIIFNCRLAFNRNCLNNNTYTYISLFLYLIFFYISITYFNLSKLFYYSFLSNFLCSPISSCIDLSTLYSVTCRVVLGYLEELILRGSRQIISYAYYCLSYLYFIDAIYIYI